MKDGIVLHPEHGLNPSIELCIVCGEEMGIALLGNNIKGQAPHRMATEPEETRTFYGWFGCLSPETKEVRLNIVKDIIKELE